MSNKGIGARIKDLREKLGLTQTDLAQAMKTTKQTVYKYENNIITNIPSDKIEVLSNVLQTNPAYLMGWEVPVEQINKHPGEMGYGYAQEIKRQNEDALKENELLQDYRRLNRPGKTKAVERVKELTEIPRYIDPEADVRFSNAQPELIEIDFYELPASAGTGMYLFDEPKEVIKVADTDTARRADFVIPVSGDSMEPDYYDGDRVFVKSMPTVEIGEIGIFVVNGESYIKERGENELISHNKARRNISLCESDTVICVGKVIGKV